MNPEFGFVGRGSGKPYFYEKNKVSPPIKITNHKRKETTMDCIFCKIVAGEIPCSKVYEDEKILAFKDINPQAPIHVIFIPKQHILTCADDINDANKEIFGDIFAAISKVAKELGLADGYRIINNCGKHGAQSVKHIHFHLLGGAQLPEDMGVRE